MPASLTRSLRRSSVRGGTGIRKVWPSTIGFRPRPAARMAFSTGPTMPLSQTLTEIMRGSGTLMAATALSGEFEP
ncbi:hypothetical protein D3C85_1815560 [compost metagenome]